MTAMAERSTRTQRTRFDFTEPLKWNAEMTDREVELAEQREELGREQRTIEVARERTKLTNQIGRFFVEERSDWVGGELLTSRFGRPSLVGEIKTRRFIRTLALTDTTDSRWYDVGGLRCVGFDVLVSPFAAVIELPEWNSSGVLDRFSKVREITNVEYHKAWMEAIEALTLP